MKSNNKILKIDVYVLIIDNKIKDILNKFQQYLHFYVEKVVVSPKLG